MPRRARYCPAGICFHVLNRAVARLPLFEKTEDYDAFERVLEETYAREPLPIFAYTVMPNHWHFVVRPITDDQLTEFFRWLTHTHTMRWHAHHQTQGTGHLYQGRFKAFPIQEDDHLLTVLRYVERNPLRSSLCQKAEDWPYGSAWAACFGRSGASTFTGGVADSTSAPMASHRQPAADRCGTRGDPPQLASRNTVWPGTLGGTSRGASSSDPHAASPWASQYQGAEMSCVPFLRLLVAIAAMTSTVWCAEPVVLPGTHRIAWPEEDLSGRMMDGAHQFVERKISDAAVARADRWQFDYSSAEAYIESIASHRQRLAEILGAVDSRSAPCMERFGDERAPALVATCEAYRVEQVRWPVVGQIHVEGLLATPAVSSRGFVVAIPDARQTPEQVLGLSEGVADDEQFARRLVENGFSVIVPALVGCSRIATDDERLQRTDQTCREWIYRQAFHMGQHVIGYEVQAVCAAVDWIEETYDDTLPIGVAGYAEGGQIAFYSAALDPRIDAALVSGYFSDRQSVWSEPIYRNVWSLLRDFGDAEIAAMILPRRLVLEHSQVPDVVDHKGEWHTPEFATVRAEANRIPRHGLLPNVPLFHDDGTAVRPVSTAALRDFAQALGHDGRWLPVGDAPQDLRPEFEATARHQRLVTDIERHIQDLVRASEHERDRFFLYSVMPELADQRWTTQRRHATHSAEAFASGAKAFRARFAADGMGRFDEPLLPLNARTRKIAETEHWTAWDVVLDAYPELFAWGVLLVPRDLQPGQQRPVVVCQHGRNGLPRSTIDEDSTAYNQFAARLAERGFITFAPHNLYRGEDRYRWLDRKANTIGCTLFSFIIAQHQQILDWLDSLPFVDGDRIAFYGLSYGGETAVRVPPVLEKYCLSICSGDFNQWTRKVAATDQSFSFMRTIEWEMPYWNLGHTFDYAEMAYLMIPRPLMVERGHLDRVGRDRWVAHEYAKVRWLYAQLGIADRTAIEFFQGGHSINGEATFAFLHQHLNWPAPRETSPAASP